MQVAGARTFHRDVETNDPPEVLVFFPDCAARERPHGLSTKEPETHESSGRREETADRLIGVLERDGRRLGEEPGERPTGRFRCTERGT